MAKQIVYGYEARQKIKKGMDIITKSVAATYGPTGRTVVIGRRYGNPLVTKDGVDDFGFNVQNRKYENLINAGVIDTTKVARVALQSAVSIAGSFLFTECAIAEKKKDHAA